MSLGHSERSEESPLSAPRSSATVWLRALRVPFFVGTLAPVGVGAAYAHFAGAPFNWPRFVLTFVGVMFTNAGLNLANDYFDHKSGDDDLTVATPVSGGSKVIQEGLLAPRQVIAAAVVFLLLAAAIGVYLNFLVGGWLILGLGVVGMLFAVGYSAPPLRLGHRRGLGELACLLGCGPVIGLGAYYVQTGHVSVAAALATLPVGMLMALILLLNEFHDRAADGRVGKNTLLVVLGTRTSAWLNAIVLALTFALTCGLIRFHVVPVAALLALAGLPIAAFVALRVLRYHADGQRLLAANFAMITLHILYSVTLIVILATA
jgi:1,4-dihydroxy-2-naphthoate polyprenyltransferase